MPPAACLEQDNWRHMSSPHLTHTHVQGSDGKLACPCQGDAQVEGGSDCRDTEDLGLHGEGRGWQVLYPLWGGGEMAGSKSEVSQLNSKPSAQPPLSL